MAAVLDAYAGGDVTETAMLTGAGLRLAAALEGREYHPPSSCEGVLLCSSAAAWEIMFDDAAAFGGCSVYSLSGRVLVERWQRGHTDDAETLELAGFREAELLLLAATA